MPCAVKIDEDLPSELADVFRSAAYDAASVRAQASCGTRDDHLWEVVRKERRCLITADKGFADVRRYAPTGTSGIVLLRLPRESRAGYLTLAKFLIANLV